MWPTRPTETLHAVDGPGGQPSIGEARGAVPDIETDLLERMYTTVLTIRRFEERAVEQYRIGNIRGYLHLYLGEEAIAVGAIAGLEPDDYIVSTHRGHGHALAKGHEPGPMMAELFGRATGYCGGRGGSMHVASGALRNLGANGIVAAGVPIAVGAAMAVRQRGGREVVVDFCSDGSSANGVWHEALNMAAIWDLPVVFVLENNQYAVSTPIAASARVARLSERAAAYGMPGLTVDGNDAVAVHEAMREPIRRARAGEGPTLVECMTYRHGGHHVNDPGLYLPPDELQRWKAHDPVDVLRARLLASGVPAGRIAEIDVRVEGSIDDAVRFAEASPQPSVEDFLAEVSTL